MKKQFYLKSLLSLLLLFVGISAWGEDVYTLTCISNSKNMNYANYYDVTIDGVKWSAPGNQSFSNFWRIGGKDINNVNRTITGKTAISNAVSSITVNHNGISSSSFSVNSVTLTVASDVSFSTVIQTITLTPDVTNSGSFKFEPSTNLPENSYYKFTFNVSNNSQSSNHGLNLTSIVFSLNQSEPSTQSPTLTESGDFQVSKEITITDNAQGAKIYYTTDGNDPTASSNEYTAPFTINQTTTVKAIAIKDGVSSKISSATYTRTYLDAELSWSANFKTVTLASLTPSGLPTLNNPHQLDITYSTTNEARAKFVDGVLMLIDGANNTGSVTIKATTNGNETYAAGEAKYTLNINMANSNVAWAESTGTTDVSDNTFTQPTTTVADNYDGAITYVSSKTDVAEVNENTGVIVIKGKGTTVITASASKTNRFNESTATYTLTVTDIENADKYELVTDASTLKAGDVITFVNESNAIGAEKTNNFDKVDVSISDKVFVAPDGMSSFTLEGSTDAWYFKDVNNKYLYAASSSSNHLKTQSTKDDNSKATITISNNDAAIIFQGTNTRNQLKYNSNNSIFSCYSNSQKPIQIYRMIVATPTSDEITISNALYATYYNSNHAYTMPSDCEGYVFTVEQGLESYYEGGEVVPAGEPLVIFSIEAGKKTLNYTANPNGSTLKSGDMNDLDGVDVETALSADENFYFYGLSLNAQSDVNSVGFYWINDGGAAFTIPAHKAYLKVAKSGSAKSFFLFNDGEVTGINSINAIDETAPVYNVQGQRVAASTKGIVIQNGRKFFNK